MRQSIRLACKFRRDLDHCYFHHSRDKCYANPDEKRFARSAMMRLWNCKSLTVEGMCFGKNHIRYVMLDEMMPEHLDTALDYCKRNQISDADEFANVLLRVVLSGEETARLMVELECGNAIDCNSAADFIPVFFRRRRFIRFKRRSESGGAA